MSRKKTEKKRRHVSGDSRFNDLTVSKFINMIMYGGQKAVAAGVFYDSMELVNQRLNEEPLKVFKKAVDNIKPNLEVRSRRVGGANYQIPVEVRPQRRQALALRWLKDSARKRPEKTMKERLANEIIEAYQSRGGAVKKKEDVHKMADANQAFSHFQF